MTKKIYGTVSGIIFIVIGVLHILRYINNWSASLGGISIPMWASLAGAVVALYLGYWGLKK